MPGALHADSNGHYRLRPALFVGALPAGLRAVLAGGRPAGFRHRLVAPGPLAHRSRRGGWGVLIAHARDRIETARNIRAPPPHNQGSTPPRLGVAPVAIRRRIVGAAPHAHRHLTAEDLIGIYRPTERSDHAERQPVPHRECWPEFLECRSPLCASSGRPCAAPPSPHCRGREDFFSPHRHRPTPARPQPGDTPWMP